MATSTLGSGTLVLAGTTSGTTTLQATAVAGTTTLTLPAATDTLVGKATTDTLTNKTLTGAAMNGTLGATTPSTGAFTTVSSTGNAAFGGGSLPVASGYQYGIGVGPNGLIGTRAAGNDYRLLIGTNSKLDGTYTSTTSQPVSLITMDNGLTSFSIGPSGTAGNAITFTQAMTLDASGNLLVGTTSAGGYKFNVLATTTYAGNFTTATGLIPLVLGITSGTGSQIYQYFYNGATNTGSITTTGTNTLYNSVSDYRLKENIAPMTGALSVVQQLKPCTYTWKADGSSGQGFVAHELQAVFPDCVSGEKDGTREEPYEVTPEIKDEQGNVVTPAEIGKRTVPAYQGIDTSFLVATLTAAIQEQQSLITQLQADVAALKGA